MSRRPATYQDVLDAPEHVTAELVDGELFLMPRGRARHALSIDEVSGALRAGGVRDGWWILPEVELWLGRPEPSSRVLVPDLSGWRKADWTPAFDEVGQTTPPAWVAEVLSPSTVRRDRLVKLALYAEAGVGHVWIVDPDARSVEVFALRDGVYALVGGGMDDEVVTLAPFDVPLALGGLWAP